MPGGDGTGPGGMGPMTGRAAGYCAGYSVPGFTNPIPGRGFRGGGGGWGFGRGRGWGRGFGMGLPASGMAPGTPYGSYNAPYGATSVVAPYGTPWAGQMTPQQELDGLKGQAEYFEDVLDGIQKRIGELEAEAKKK